MFHPWSAFRPVHPCTVAHWAAKLRFGHVSPSLAGRKKLRFLPTEYNTDIIHFIVRGANRLLKVCFLLLQ